MLTLEDYQAALNEANAQITALSNRSQQLAIQVAQLSKKVEKLKAPPVPETKPVKGSVGS